MRRHRDQKEILKKNALLLVRTRDALFRQERNAPLVPIDEPYQFGVVRRFSLVEEAQNRDDSHALSYAVKIGTTPVSLSFRFLKSSYIKEEDKYPAFKHIRENNFANLSLHPQVAALFFKYWYKDGYRYTLKTIVRNYCEVQEEPWMVTHYRSILPEIVSLSKLVSNHMINHGYWITYSKVKGHRYKEKEDVRFWRKKFSMNKEDASDFKLAKSAILGKNEFDINNPSKDLPALQEYEGHQEADYYYCQTLLNKKNNK